MDIFDADIRNTNLGAFGDRSFRVNDKLIRQSVILLPRSVLLWDVATPDEITIESLSIFELIYPTIEVLFIGTGYLPPNKYPYDIIRHFKSKGINIEISKTSTAAGTFNTLVTEGRNVAAALLTMIPVVNNEKPLLI
jgi:NADH dehydrogenase [ubiquinone] 1 alpha subcomplex assembly factor 3